MSGIEACGVVAIIRIADGSMLQSVASALIDGGVTTIEVTMTVPRAIELIAGLAGTLPSAVTLGAGTVLDAATARDVIAAGARFVVSPIFKPELIEACHAA